MITVVGRKLVIPEKDSQIGTTYDNNSEVRHIRLNRITAGGVDLANLRFKLDLEYEDAILDTCLLDAEVQEAYILLTWNIPAACVSHKGTVWIAVRAYDENGTIKWATNPGAVYAGHTIFDGEAYKGHLAEFEQLEERITQKAETLDANESKRQEAEEQRKANEERRVNNEAEWQRQAETAIAKANTTLEKATEKAEEATQAARTATAKAEVAEASSMAANQSANTASQAANTAATRATEAERSATAANQSANTASQAAATATNKATEAERSAEEANQIAQGLGGFNGKASSVSAVDEQGLLGGADGTSNVQELLDALAQKVALELVSNTKLVEILSGYIATSSINNTGLVTEEGFVADARQMNPNVAGSLAAKVKKNTDDIVTANSNLANKNNIGTYHIPDIIGVSTAPENIAGGYHNVAKYSNGQCMYSALVYVYTSAISNSVIGTISSQYAPKQDISAYVYDFAGNRFLMVLISSNGTIKLLTLEGAAIPESAVKLRGSVVF